MRSDTKSAELFSQLSWFVGSGAVCSAAQAGIYVTLRQLSSAAVASLIALLVTTVANTEAHRRWTFSRSRTGIWRAHSQAGLTAAVVFVLSLTLLTVAESSWSGTNPVAEAVVIAMVTTAAGTFRFLVLRNWVFVRRAARKLPRQRGGSSSAPPMTADANRW